MTEKGYDKERKPLTMNINTIFIIIAIIVIIFGAGESYGILTTLETKINDLEEKIDTFKEDYARKDVIETRLNSIDLSVKEIKDDIRIIRDE